MPTITAKTNIKRHPDIAWRKIGDYLMAITPGNNAVHRFNGTGAAVWEILGEQGKSFQQICHQIVDNFQASPSEVKKDITTFIEDISAKGIITLD